MSFGSVLSLFRICVQLVLALPPTPRGARSWAHGRLLWLSPECPCGFLSCVGDLAPTLSLSKRSSISLTPQEGRFGQTRSKIAAHFYKNEISMDSPAVA